jgi:hypothetical protein
MRKGRFSEEQIMGGLTETESGLALEESAGTSGPAIRRTKAGKHSTEGWKSAKRGGAPPRTLSSRASMVRVNLVVILPPVFDSLARFAQIPERVLVQALVPQLQKESCRLAVEVLLESHTLDVTARELSPC